MKKLFSILLTLSLSAALLAGCGSQEETPAETPAEETPAQEETLSGSVSTNGSTSMEKVL